MALIPFSAPVSTRDTTRTVGRDYQAVVLMVIVSLLLLGGFGSRLAYLQLVQGDENRQLAENNRIRLLPKRPARGSLLDRNGRLLAGNRLSHSVTLWPIALPKSQWPEVIRRLSTLLNIPAEDIQTKLEQAGYSSLEAVSIARGISPAQATALAEYSAELPAVRLEAEAVRSYPNGDLAAHVLGYTGELTQDELQERQDDGYRLGDVVGRMGAEAAFEADLRGQWGGQQVEIDSSGRVLRVLGDKPAISGQDVQLTLDLEIQRAAEQALGDQIGAIVAMDPNNGAVLAMVSRPAFDPNIFSTRITEAQWRQLQSASYPFLNRALRAYPPASTFKIVTTSAALESGRYSAGTVLPTYPYVEVGGRKFWDWNKAGFGPLGFTGAMAMSSDTFFYQIAMGIKQAPLVEWTRRYGFGQKTGIEIGADESAGLVPDNEWKVDNVGHEWSIGDTINMSIGQGFLQATPLQVAVMFAIAANGGYRVTPHLLQEQEDTRDWRDPIDLSPTTLDILQKGLRRVITSGTARALNDPNLPPLAGKTGTAEAPPGKSHAWFGGYMPADNPDILVVAFAEHSGGGGSAVAAPMVKQVLDAYFKGQSQ